MPAAQLTELVSLQAELGRIRQLVSLQESHLDTLSASNRQKRASVQLAAPLSQSQWSELEVHPAELAGLRAELAQLHWTLSLQELQLDGLSSLLSWFSGPPGHIEPVQAAPPAAAPSSLQKQKVRAQKQMVPVPAQKPTPPDQKQVVLVPAQKQTVSVPAKKQTVLVPVQRPAVQRSTVQKSKGQKSTPLQRPAVQRSTVQKSKDQKSTLPDQTPTPPSQKPMPPDQKSTPPDQKTMVVDASSSSDVDAPSSLMVDAS
ncbi:uncharacterized protein [Nothobranchius furzeri]|uniref:uncharacterized protein n=1 Tax=Nothobranchius furzeri TaxID=105023 RepID=UPI003904BC4E